MKGFFADDYATARSSFLGACQTKQCRLKMYKNDRCNVIDGAELIADIARFGSDQAEKVLVLISGTHGVEGFCGSACQSAAVTQGLFGDLPPGLAGVMIHAINPYGFMHCRRVTEYNVDLNRNCVA